MVPARTLVKPARTRRMSTVPAAQVLVVDDDPVIQKLLQVNPTYGKGYALSYLFWIQSPGLLWTAHTAALAVFAMPSSGNSASHERSTYGCTLRISHTSPALKSARFGIST